ncbi:2-oxoacid:acceptor oxidoreductase, alpha subunit [Peptoniphilus duerdenii ATCC BAA-1640]|uniref:2-oxoacid:acceptor oxidoreductase, alpha subunit n=1 Tax=Peptoniphilus duerdenii ATCC BAA-1640 TaxID=862517 RepID=E0NKT5_9FIRM|nr:2-oxoacid:acceptor oxidoreductase subunit alpha [Peptoniphilus duerdenii]EFM25600.1 2-oxoacid:acceptor oxidoreductase, alpha subunit [Peptoniphilus duerdenii ATCC BAA-1640]
MDRNVLIGGAAGQGMDTVANLFNKVLQRSGYYVYTTSDYRSRVRGGHNFFQIRFSDREISSPRRGLDVIFALNEETLERHLDRLNEGGVSFCDEGIEGFEGTKKYNLVKKAKELGNPKMISTIGLGMLLGKLKIDVKVGEEVVRETFKEGLIEGNIKALDYGYSITKTEVNPIEARESILINGNQAVGLGAAAAGCKFYAAYPMTPSSGVLGFLSSVSDELEIVVDQCEDEVAALNMALGASFAGVRAMTGSSGAGMALMSEAFSLAGIIETPVVIIDVQRPGPATGLPTDTEQADLRFLIHNGHGEFPRKVIALRSAEDAFYQTTRAFNLADKYQIPVILMSDKELADTKISTAPFDFSKIEINRYLADPNDYEPGTYNRYEITDSGVSPRLIPTRANGNMVMVDSDEHDEFGRTSEDAQNRIAQVDKRHRKFEGIIADEEEPWEIGVDDFDTLVVCWGSTYGVVKESIDLLNEKGHKIKGLVFGDVFPLPLKKFKKFHSMAKNYIVVEMNRDGQFEGLIRQEALVASDHLITKYDGRPFYLEELVERLEEVL